MSGGWAGLFSAVTSAFIDDVQGELEPNFQETSQTLLESIADAAPWGITTSGGAVLPQWNGPDPTTVLDCSGMELIRIAETPFGCLSRSCAISFLAKIGERGSFVGQKVWKRESGKPTFLEGDVTSIYIFRLNEMLVSDH